MTPILEIIGPKGTGKTTLNLAVLKRWLPKQLNGKPIATLVIDASSDLDLTQALYDEFPKITLGQLITQLENKYKDIGRIPETSIDAAYPDVIYTAEEGLDILPVGTLFLRQLSDQIIGYGLPRLIQKNYQLVLIDGYLKPIHQALHHHTVYPIAICSPQFIAALPRLAVLTDKLPKQQQTGLILNHCPADTLPEEAQQLMADQTIKFLGRIPPYDENAPFEGHLLDALGDCLNKLDFTLSE